MLTLHIGLPKTGTTFLQYRVFNRQREIQYIHHPRDERFSAVERLLKEYQRARFRRARSLAKLIAAQLPDGDVLVSNENISITADEAWDGGGPSPLRVAERVARLGARVGGVRVLLGIRRQDQWLGSRYAESAKHFVEFGQHDFEQRVGRLCATPLEGAMQWLDYGAAFSALADRLGEDRVLLVPSETLLDQPELALERVQRFVGCTSFVDVYRGQLGRDADMRRNVLSVGDNRWSMRGRDDTLTLPDRLMQRVLERFAEGNRIVAKLAELDIERYGYV